MNLKMNLKYLQIQKWILQAGKAEKDEKNGVICVVFMFPSWVMILKLLKKVHFFHFVLTSAKMSKAIYIYASEIYRYALSENVIVYYAMTSCFEDISVWNRRTLLNFCWVSIVFDILIANISWTVAQTPINHIIFWKTVMRTFRSIYVNYFNTLRFLAEVSTKLQKMHFLDNLRTITQEGSMEIRQMTPFFHPLFLPYCSKLNSPFSAVLSLSQPSGQD